MANNIIDFNAAKNIKKMNIREITENYPETLETLEKIYKEYEFENQNTKGIIDLFSVREKDILLVDYKLKNMEDDAYKLQLKIYASYLENAFHLPVQAYLYSLLTGEIQKVDLAAIQM